MREISRAQRRLSLNFSLCLEVQHGCPVEASKGLRTGGGKRTAILQAMRGSTVPSIHRFCDTDVILQSLVTAALLLKF